MKHIIGALLLLAGLVAIGFAQDQKPAAPAPAPTVAPAPAPTLTAEVQVCTSITDRMPSGSAASFNADVGTLYCWCKITGAGGGTTIKHVWVREGKEMATVELPVKGVSWRTHSQKKILPPWTGNWEVKVVDAGGTTLKSITFTINSPDSTLYSK